MCGICGFVGPRERSPGRDVLERMNASIRHRGPDDDGFYFSEAEAGPSCALAMRRLAVIDLSTGHQPIQSGNGHCWIVYNGEVYNFLELRRQLENLGHQFSTDTDTEVVLHAYQQFGLDFVHRLRGMFAVAIWDVEHGRLVLARDPVGIKPLFYTQVDEHLVFGSEIKALLAYPGVPRQLNLDALPHFLTYLYAPAPATMFKDVHQLPPGHLLVWEGGAFTVREYWRGPLAWVDPQVDLASRNHAPPGPEELWDGLSESVGAHLVADVPVGAFLSGGIDSSAIVAMMAQRMNRQVQTFSIGFQGAGLYDESAHAQEMATRVGAEHRVLHLDQAALERLPEILRHLDEPMADASVIPNYFLAEMARKHVTVVLTGIGGDELFGGYRRYTAHRLAEGAAWLPRALRNEAILPLLHRFSGDSSTRIGNLVRLADKFFSPLDLSAEERYVAWNSFYTEAEKSALLLQPPSGPTSASLCGYLFRRARHRPFADRAMYVDLKTYLPGDPLLLGDRLTMAHGLEARVPFLDLRVMEMAARIPVGDKINGLSTKTILRKACRGHIPEKLVARPKQGFGTPIELWLRGGAGVLVDQLLSDEAVEARGLFRPEAIRQIVTTFRKGGREVSQHLWALLMLELWARAYLDNDYSSRTNLSFKDLSVNM